MTTVTSDNRIATPVQQRPSSTTTEVVGGGASFEALAGAGVVALAILGLVNVLPADMVAIAVIVAGGGLLLRGVAVAARQRQLLARLSGNLAEAEFGGGLVAEVVVGLGGVALGILALLSVAPATLVAAAVIGFGAAIFLGAGSSRAVEAALRGYDGQTAAPWVNAGAAGDVLIGLGVAALGILALIGLAPQTLTLIGLVAVGAGLLLEATPVLARVLHLR